MNVNGFEIDEKIMGIINRRRRKIKIDSSELSASAYGAVVGYCNDRRIPYDDIAKRDGN